MSLKAGRVGVAPSEVDEFGQIIGEITPTNVYTKTQADAKFETQTHASTERAKLQPKTLSVPISMLEGSSLVPKTTVEAVIQTMNNAMTNRELTTALDTKANTSSLAPVENGTTASQDIPYGTPFIRNGDWCISRGITSGATLIEDSNYVVDTVGGTFDNYYSLSRYYSKPITSSSDLNDYTNVGSYYCSSSTIAASLSNCPFSDTGFKLIVESVAGGTGQYRLQTIKRSSANNAPEIYIRKGYDTTWYNWYLFTGTEIVPTP